MRKPESARLAWAAGFMIVAGLSAMPGPAQIGAPPASPAPDGLRAGTGAPFAKGHHAALDQLPDLGGIWFLTFDRAAGPAPKPRLKGSYKAAYDAWLEEVRANHGETKSDSSHCSPPGMPMFMQIPQYPMEFLLTPGRVTINAEAWMQTRSIWTDGRAHPADPDPSFAGDSIGHWEKGTLVVDTVAIKSSLALAMGMTHSDKLRITERIGLKPGQPDILVDEMVLTDPDALEEPFRVTTTYRRDRYGKLLEFECAENDRNPVDAKGDTRFDP